MKKVLSLLIAFVLLQSQTWALSGGPRFGSGNIGSNGGSGGLSVVGTYGGVLLPGAAEADADAGTDPAVDNVVGARATSIGLFSFAVNESGPAIGAAVVFVEGTAFNGTITGIADPLDGAFRGIIDAISTYTISIPVTTTTVVNGVTTNTTTLVDTNVFAQGSIEATISSPTGGFAVDPLTGVNAGTTRVDGLATVDIFYLIEDDGTPAVTNSVTFQASGFKQSDTAAPATFAVGANTQPVP